jgi:hypothetical protein
MSKNIIFTMINKDNFSEFEAGLRRLGITAEYFAFCHGDMRVYRVSGNGLSNVPGYPERPNIPTIEDEPFDFEVRSEEDTFLSDLMDIWGVKKWRKTKNG